MLTFHLWKMDQVFSSPDGTVQFIELRDPSNGENHLSGHFISSNENTFTFPSDLPSDATANTHFLIGTTDYAKQPGAVTPDYTVPDNFFSVSGDSLNYADVDSFSFTAAQLPTDGANSLFRDVNTFNLSTGPNSETNFAGQTGSVTVSAGASPTGVGVTLAASEGAAFSGNVATINEAGAKPGDFSTTINWGDGGSSAGTVAADPNGGFDVVGNHTYAEEGTSAVQVIVTDAHSHTITVNSQANVADAPLAATAVPFSLASGLTLNDATVATFTDAGGADATANYAATIDWGDGSSATAGTVAAAAGGVFQVTGSHTYAVTGNDHVAVTIHDEGGAEVRVTPSPSQLFVAAVYHDVLGRAPDPGGLSYWTQLLDSGAAVSSVAAAIAHSDEYYANFVIRPAYVKLLDRVADAGGVTYWTSQMDAGVTDQQLEADLVSSPEFYTNAGGTNTAWIDAVYKLLLGRTADAGGEKFWNSQLDAGQTLNQVAQGIAGSQENDTQLIND
ncbi:MAG TPA: DUF4214 domain-containing protein, partial [Pirellulales bacterium]|nr:DUF4214 domain-containing protein [Pirellulales bacterium]